jgi:hypothetical protein
VRLRGRLSSPDESFAATGAPPPYADVGDHGPVRIIQLGPGDERSLDVAVRHFRGLEGDRLYPPSIHIGRDHAPADGAFHQMRLGGRGQIRRDGSLRVPASVQKQCGLHPKR